MEVLEIYIQKQLGDTLNQVKCLISLALTLHNDRQLDAAEEVASRAIKLLPEKGQQLKLCHSHHILGDIYCSKSDTERAIHHSEVALGIATSLSLSQEQFWVHISLATLFFGKRGFDAAHAHAERAKSHVLNDPYNLAHALWLQAFSVLQRVRS